jgi:NTP pyrophosphatase (non-canonical NTP hydrolase)
MTDDEKMTIAEWQKVIHANNVEKGWWEDGERNFGEVAMLIVTEVAEAMEAWRDDEPMVCVAEYVGAKPEGIAVEMADAVIRIFDWAESVGVDLGDVIARKHAYNKTRPYRHGGKKA